MRRAKDVERLSWDQYRKRMLAETARFIEWGLRHPDEVIEIPIKPSDDGGFPPAVGRWFWAVVLTDQATDKVRRWRNFLLRRPRGMLRKLGLR
ncbi:MAG TPA: hypothetical protein VM695_05335 [Phycisphaerae bacterium]|nr:hypothetical protein [Phycisphaerae bacterium]